ncbi:MAG: Maf family protein [Cellulosilyticaceae bacterium]
MKKLILASQSPRRKELMELLPIEFDIDSIDVDETLDMKKSPSENVCELSYKKANALTEKYPNNWIIGCDTIVSLEGCLLGKPKDVEDAKKMLRQLSDKKHQVYTGVTLINKDKGIIKTFYESTDIKIKKLSEEFVKYYIETKEPFDKAGSYAIQGYGSVMVESMSGDYFNVVGLPISKLYDVCYELEIISL